jgi:general stress protein 26
MTPLRAGILLSFLLSTAAVAQQVPPPQPSRADVLAAGRDIVQKAGYCSLVTIGEDGHPQARIVDPLGPDESFTLWVGTNPLTRKANQIRRDPRVTLLCFETATSSYVSVLAKAVIVTDATERERRWKAEWKPFYAAGPSGNDFLLIRLDPTRLEIVSVARGFAPDAKSWLPIAITFP